MKKTLPIVIALLALLAGAFVFMKKAGVLRKNAAELVPAQTLFFAHLPDLARTGQRWPETALAQIWREPDVQAFLEKPRAKAPQMQLWQAKLDALARTRPAEAFFAVTSIEGPQPKLVGGFAFSGRQAEVEALLAEPRAELKRAYPAGKSDLVTHGAAQIETFTYGETQVAETISGGWYFVANNLELLKATLDASAGSGNPADTLKANEGYAQATARVPKDHDALFFGQVSTLTDRITSLLVASGQAPDPKQLEQMKRVQSIAWSVKLDGAQLRDTIAVWAPGTPPEDALKQSALGMTTPETFLYYAAALPKSFELPAQSTAALAMFVPGFGLLEKTLAEKGLKWSDLSAAFGPAFGAVGDWPETQPQPSMLFAVDVRDAAKAKGFVDVFTAGMGTPAWGREEKAGITVYQSPATPGLALVSPALAMSDHALVLGFSPEAARAGAEKQAASQSPLTAQTAYQAAEKLVGKPTSAFGYLDLKTLFERSYGTFRPFLAMSLAFSPDAGKFIDASKLPSTETISRHLSPSVYSQSVNVDGTLIESAGTLTLNQVLGVGVGGALAAAYPMLEKAIAGGLKLDPSLLALPPAAPAAPLPNGVAPASPAPSQP